MSEGLLLRIVADFKALLLKYPIVNPVLMGFPTSWGNEALWQ
jgi:hypothetical protein